jgi:hypothetical protein
MPNLKVIRPLFKFEWRTAYFAASSDKIRRSFVGGNRYHLIGLNGFILPAKSGIVNILLAETRQMMIVLVESAV